VFKKLLGLLSDSVIYGLSGSLSRLIGLILLPILGDYLDLAEFGVYFMLGIVVMLFGPLANLGMTNAVFRRFNQNKDPEYRASVLSTGLVSIAISSCLLLILTQALAPWIAVALTGDVAITPLLRLTLIGATASSISAIFFVALRASRRVKMAATMNVLKVLVYGLATLTLVIGFEMGLRGVVLGSLIGELFGASAQLLVTLREFRGRPQRDLWRDMIGYGLPFTPHQLQMAALELFGIYMVREMLGLEAAGIYGVAARFASPVSLVVNSVQTSWVPYKFQIHAEDPNPKAFFQSALLYYLTGLAYLWLGVSLWGPEVVRWLMGEEFNPSAAIIWATTLVPAVHGIYYMAGTGFELQRKTQQMPLVSFLGLLTVVGSAFLLVPNLGALGAALATTLAWVVMAATIYTLSQRRFPIDYDWPTIATCVALAAVMVAAGYAVQSQKLPVRLAIITLLSLAYPPLCTLILLRSRDERPRVRQLLAKLRLA
jgi:O-antigen/teichoic acid export membrane protein